MLMIVLGLERSLAVSWAEKQIHTSAEEKNDVDPANIQTVIYDDDVGQVIQIPEGGVKAVSSTPNVETSDLTTQEIAKKNPEQG